MAVSKLYFKGECLACRGSHKTWYGKHCPYCFGGSSYYEGSEETIKSFVLENMSEDGKKELLEKLKQHLGEED